MAVGQRPSGLTAFAIVNFVFAGFGGLGCLGMIAGAAVLKHSGYHFPDPKAEAAVQQIAEWLPLLVVTCTVSTLLLIVSGFGFLKQSRVLGRYVGSAYGIFGLLMVLINFAIVHQPFGIGTITGLVYPIVVLILVNTTFRDDLTS